MYKFWVSFENVLVVKVSFWMGYVEVCVFHGGC